MSTFFRSTFSSNNSTTSLNTSSSKTSTASKAVTPQITKKSLTYILNTSKENELNGHHSIGVNSLLYNDHDNCLISGGRDGQISIWKFNENYQHNSEPTDTSNELFKSNEQMRDYIHNNVNDEEEYQKLQLSVAENFSSFPINKSDSTPSFYKNSYLHHFGWINDLQLLDDAKTIASCSNDLSIKLWNYETNTKSTLGFHDDYVKKIRFSRQHPTQLVSAGLDKVIKIWDIQKKTTIEKFKFTDHNSSVYSLDVNNNLIICSGPSNTIKLFDRRDMSGPVKSFSGHTDNVRSIILKDNTILSGSSDTSVKLWDLRTTRVLRNFDMHSSPVWSIYADKESSDFSQFYSADKSGLLLKTDLRTSNLDPISDATGYLNNKVNESLGISTVIADVNCVNQIEETEDMLKNESHMSGINAIVHIPQLNTVWTAISSNAHSSNTNFISSWTVPETGNLLLHQGVVLNRKLLNVMDPPSNGEVPMSRAKSYDSVINDADDLVSHLSTDDLDQLDNAIFSNVQGLDNILRPPIQTNSNLSNSDISGNSNVNFNFDKEDVDYDDDSQSGMQYGTFFINFNGDLNTQFLFTDGYYESEEIENVDSLDPFDKPNDVLKIVRKLNINNEYIEEDDALLLPFNIKPIDNISGTSGLVRCKILNNRRHVAAMDQSGCIYIYDILVGKLIQQVDFTDAVTTANDGSQTPSNSSTKSDSNINLIERFESICDGFQTTEALPTWCSVQVKSGQLFITIQENTFTSCEVESDEFYKEYNVEMGKTDSRVNIGKCVMKSFFGDLVENFMKSNKATLEIKQPQPVYNANPVSSNNSIHVVHSSTHGGVKIPQPAPQTRSYAGTPTGTSSPEKSTKRGLFGRRKVSKKETSPIEQSSNKVSGGDKLDSYLDKLNKTYTTTELIKLVESHEDIFEVLKYKPNYEDQLVESEETPKLEFTDCCTSTLIVVNEETSHETRPAFSVHLDEILNNESLDKVEVLSHLPVWLTKGLMLHLYPIPSHLLSTVGFVVLPVDGSKLSKVEENGSPLRLNSSGTLKISRMIGFIKGKLPEKERNFEIELLCKGTVLREKETLGNIKTRMWKQGGDVEIRYRIRD